MNIIPQFLIAEYICFIKWLCYERAIYYNYNMLVNQVRNIHHSERQVQSTVENNRRGNFPELRLVHSAKEPGEKPEKTTLYIKNMVSVRCKIVLEKVLENLGINYSKVELGEVEIIGNISDVNAKHEQLKFDLLNCGLELMEDRKIILVEKIVHLIINMIHHSDELPDIKFSHYLSEKLNYNYTYLSNLFSEVKGISTRHFIILHKIERVKELLAYGEFTLSEIAWKLQYSSVSHLSSQFKQITGLAPSHFKNMKDKRRCTLDNI